MWVLTINLEWNEFGYACQKAKEKKKKWYLWPDITPCCVEPLYFNNMQYIIDATETVTFIIMLWSILHHFQIGQISVF